MSTAIVVHKQDKKSILEAMRPELRRVAARFDEASTAIATGMVMVYYDLGMHVRDALSNDGKYGTAAAQQLAAYVGQNVSFIYKLRDVVNEYTKADIKALLARKTVNNRNIEWNHLVLLSSVQKAQERRSLTGRIFSAGLSVRKLQEEVAVYLAKRDADKPPSAAGRPVSRPLSLEAGIVQIIKACDELRKRVAVWDECVAAPLQELSAGAVTGALVKRIGMAKNTIMVLHADLINCINGLDKGTERLRRILSTRAPAEAEALDGELDPEEDPEATDAEFES